MRASSRLITVILSIGLMLLIAACGTSDTPPSEPDVVPSPTRERDSLSDDNDSSLRVEGFSVNVSGGEAVDFGGAGSVTCENDRYALRAASGDLPQIAITLPPDIATGSHPIGQMGGRATSWATLTLEDNSVYAGNVSGTIVLNSFSPQQVQGSFAFSASNGRTTVNVQGSFDFAPTSFPLSCGT